jgi:hypothetical protein
MRGLDKSGARQARTPALSPTASWRGRALSLRQILSDWTPNPTKSNQSPIRQRFNVNYNAKYTNTLSAGSGIDWFFYKPPTTSSKKATDFLN